MASSGTPSPSESVGGDGVTQPGDEKAVGPGAAWVVPIGSTELGTVSALIAASTSSRAVAPMSPVTPSPGPALSRLSESRQAPVNRAVRARARYGARVRAGVMP